MPRPHGSYLIPHILYFMFRISNIQPSLVGKCFLPEINIRQYGISGKQPVNGCPRATH